MTAVTGTYQTYTAKGIKEDLADIIYRITPTKTPFMSAIPKVKASNTYHEWQTQDLAAAAANAQIEGDDVSSFTTVTPTVRLGNYTQISTKNVIISGTNQAVKSAGRNNEVAYQLSMKSAELKRDMEISLTSGVNASTNTTAVAGNASTARSLRGLEGWLATNLDLGATGAAPVYTSNPGTAPTDGTQRAFTEAQLKNVLQLIYVQGGEPDMIMVGPAQKQTFSTFTGGSTRFDKAEDKSVTASVDRHLVSSATLH